MKIYTVQYGSIYAYNERIIKEPSMIIDVEDGIVLNMGNKDFIKTRYNKIIKAFKDANLNANFTMIVFNEYVTKLTKEEICTIFNYFTEVCGIPNVVKEFVNLKTELEIKAWIKTRQDWGY